MQETAHQRLLVVLIGAGLPQFREQTGKAKSYAERLFDSLLLGALSAHESKTAIEKTIELECVVIEARRARREFLPGSL